MNTLTQEVGAERKTRHITIDPITRLEGHGKIEIFLNDDGNVEEAYLQIPELRGFERFVEGRPAEELPLITPRICGVCPMAHHMASTKALDAVFAVEPTSAAKKIREMAYSAYYFYDHLLHFYYLGGPDFVVGPDAPAAQRNVLGVIGKVGLEVGKKVIEHRSMAMKTLKILGGKNVHPAFGLPGGVSRAISEDERKQIEEWARKAVEFCKFTFGVFQDVVLSNQAYVDLIVSDTYTTPTYHMGLVDANNKVNFYDGRVRVVDPDGKEFAKFSPSEYLDHIEERVETWTHTKFTYLKKVGWKGFVGGKDSGVYRVAPMARLNASDGMATPLAQEEYEKLYATLSPDHKPVQHTLATHWARIIELCYAAEHWVELITDPEITSTDIRNLPTRKGGEGVGIVEAARGVLIHHYKTDEDGFIKRANLIVATGNNYAVMNMGIRQAAKGMIKNGQVNDGLLNMVEMAFRAYDPCMACATHSLPGQMPLEVVLRNSDGEIVGRVTRNPES